MKHVVNMANSIVGVSILSMPYCFKETGLVLGILLVLLSGLVTKKTCMFLIRSAIMARRRSYEFLAFHVFGVSGKLFVELCMILFLIGICISFHVVMGDLAPAIIARLMDIENSPSLRCTLLIGVTVLVVLPLCLLRNLDSLASMSACSIGFYFFLILVILWHAFPKLMDGSWYHMAELFRPSGALQVLPICMLGLSCQSNVFEIYDSIPDPDVPKMRSVVNHAVNLCCALYISVGFLGYVAFVDQDLAGNLILSFPSSHLTEGIKVFFTVSLAISFPLMIFPCRTSIHSLLYRRNNPSSFDLVGNYMPESRFKGITIGILASSLVVGILIPNIEFVLGLLGSTMGMLIALFLPSLLFIRVHSKASAERLLAQGIMLVGIVLIVTGTYLTLSHINQVQTEQQAQAIPDLAKNAIDPNLRNIENNVVDESKIDKVVAVRGDSATRREPVAPEPPPEEIESKNEEIANRVLKSKDAEDLKEAKIEKEIAPGLDKIEVKKEIDVQQKLENVRDEKNEGDTLHPDAIKKEEKVNKEEGNENKVEVDKKQAELLEKIEVQYKEQQKILAEQKQILQELKDQKAKQEPKLNIQKEERRINVDDVQPVAKNQVINIGNLQPQALNLVEPAAVIPVGVNHAVVSSGDLLDAPVNPKAVNPTAGKPARLPSNDAGQVNNVIASPVQGKKAPVLNMDIPQQGLNQRADQPIANQNSLPNYPISGNRVFNVGSLMGNANNQPGNVDNQAQPAVVLSHNIGQSIGVARSDPKEKLAPENLQVLLGESQANLEVSVHQLQKKVPVQEVQSQDKPKVPVGQLEDVQHIDESLLLKRGDTAQASDIKKAVLPVDNQQVNIELIGRVNNELPKSKEIEKIPLAINKPNNLPSQNEVENQENANNNKIKEDKKKTDHDEERRKRQADDKYAFNLPEVDLLKEIKPRDTDVVYDTRHLLWSSRSRRKRRRNDRGRDDYYWDET